MDENQEQHYQPEQSGMYELEFPAPQLSSSDGRGPVMIHALEGFSDAGTRSGWPPSTSRTRWTPSWWRPSPSMNCSTTGPAGR